MPRTFKAIVFDFDGLIVDTEVPAYEARRSVFRAYDVDLPLSTWLPLIGGGHGSFDIYDHLAEVSGRQVDRDQVRRKHRAAFEVLFEQSAPLPGIEDYIASARERGLRIGIASSSPRSWVRPKLEHVGLARGLRHRRVLGRRGERQAQPCFVSGVPGQPQRDSRAGPSL